jgi:hypothetical protein
MIEGIKNFVGDIIMRIVRSGGWDNILGIKSTAAVSFSPEEMERMRGEGIFPITDPEFVEPNKMPGVDSKKKDIKSLVGQLSLPRILFPNQNNIIEIEGTQYYLVDVKAPQKKANPEGSLYLMDLQTGQPVRLPLTPHMEHIESLSAERTRESSEKINEKIRNWNSKVGKVGNSANPTTWPLQLTWAENAVNERMIELAGMIQSSEESIAGTPERSESYHSSIDRLKADLLSGAITEPADIIDTAVFIYGEDPVAAREVVEQMPASEDIKMKINELIRMQESAAAEATEQKRQKDEARQMRMVDDDTDYGDPSMDPIEEVEPSSRKNYPKPSQYYSRETYRRQPHAQLETLRRDLEELSDIQASLTNLRGYIGSLASGERSNEILSQEEGRGADIRGSIKEFLDGTKKFLKRYSSSVFQQNEEGGFNINPKLFSSKGAGNAEVAVVLNQMISVIANSLATHEPSAPEPEMAEEGMTYAPADVQDV